MRCCLLTLALAAAAVAGMGCGQLKMKWKPAADVKPATNQETAASQEAGADDEPLPLVDDEPLLLLDEGSDPDSPAGIIAINSRCYVCHMNYVKEDVALLHALASIGCADCHGESDAHIADESWSWGGKGTAPDMMYPRAEINPLCMGCHPKDKIGSEEHEPFLDGTVEEKYCTDCHGEHRLARRRCKWK